MRVRKEVKEKKGKCTSLDFTTYDGGAIAFKSFVRFRGAKVDVCDGSGGVSGGKHIVSGDNNELSKSLIKIPSRHLPMLPLFSSVDRAIKAREITRFSVLLCTDVDRNSSKWMIKFGFELTQLISVADQ